MAASCRPSSRSPAFRTSRPGGNVTPAYEVTVDPQKLDANNLTLTDVVNTVATSNVRAPGGIVYQPNREDERRHSRRYHLAGIDLGSADLGAGDVEQPTDATAGAIERQCRRDRPVDVG